MHPALDQTPGNIHNGTQSVVKYCHVATYSALYTFYKHDNHNVLKTGMLRLSHKFLDIFARRK